MQQKHYQQLHMPSHPNTENPTHNIDPQKNSPQNFHRLNRRFLDQWNSSSNIEKTLSGKQFSQRISVGNSQQETVKNNQIGSQSQVIKTLGEYDEAGYYLVKQGNYSTQNRLKQMQSLENGGVKTNLNRIHHKHGWTKGSLLGGQGPQLVNSSKAQFLKSSNSILSYNQFDARPNSQLMMNKPTLFSEKRQDFEDPNSTNSKSTVIQANLNNQLYHASFKKGKASIFSQQFRGLQESQTTNSQSQLPKSMSLKNFQSISSNLEGKMQNDQIGGRHNYQALSFTESAMFNQQAFSGLRWSFQKSTLNQRLLNQLQTLNPQQRSKDQMKVNEGRFDYLLNKQGQKKQQALQNQQTLRQSPQSRRLEQRLKQTAISYTSQQAKKDRPQMKQQDYANIQTNIHSNNIFKKSFTENKKNEIQFANTMYKVKISQEHINEEGDSREVINQDLSTPKHNLDNHKTRRFSKLESDQNRFSTFLNANNANKEQEQQYSFRKQKHTKARILFEVEDATKMVGENIETDFSHTINSSRGLRKRQQTSDLVQSSDKRKSNGLTPLQISQIQHQLSPQVTKNSKQMSNTSLQGDQNQNNFFYRRASNLGMSRKQRSKYALKMSKIVKDLFDRDHSQTSDFNSINSFDSASDSGNSKQTSDLKRSIKVTSLGGRESKQLIDSVVFETVFGNDYQRLKEYLAAIPTQYEKQKKLNARDKHGRSPLFYALYHNNYELVNHLLNQGADTLFIDKHGKTVLHYASILGVNKHIFQLLIDFNNKLDVMAGHTEEASSELERREPNKFDVPPRRQRQRGSIIPQIAIPPVNIENIKAGQKQPSLVGGVPQQPQTSLLPKKGRELNPLRTDIQMNKQLQAKDDTFDPNKLSIQKIQEELNSEDHSSSQYSSRLQQVSMSKNPILMHRKTIRFNQANNQGGQNNPLANLKQNTLNPGQQEEDPAVKAEEERKIKKLKAYQLLGKKFVNLADNQGKTALHFATQKGNMLLIQNLFKYSAVPLIRDYKSRKPIELTTDESIKDLLRKEETMFEEKFQQNPNLLKKSLVLDDFEKLKQLTQNINKSGMSGLGGSTGNLLGKNLLGKNEEIKEQLNESDLNSTMMQAKQEHAEVKKQFNQRMSRRMQFNKTELASMSDAMLTNYCIGIYKDNSLTYKIRFEDRENFKYLLLRGISVLSADSDGNNVIHYAIKLEKLEFISFLMEGKFESEIMKMCGFEKGSGCLKDQFTHKSAKEICETIRMGSFPWIPSSLLALEKSNYKDGNTCLHMAIDLGNPQIFNYVLCMLKVRDHMRGIEKNKYWDLFKLSAQVFEFKNKLDNTPLLFSAKRNQLQLFEILVENGCNMYAICNKFMNVLHYAVLNENQSMIEQIVYADAESDRLMKEKNFRDESPLNMDDRSKYENIFHHIWEAASISTPLSLERLDWLIKTEKYQASQKTLIGQNTPLHFAVIHENLKAIELICKQSDVVINQKNALGQTPIDLARLIPKKKISLKIIEYLNKKQNGSVTKTLMQHQLTISPTPQTLQKQISAEPQNSSSTSLVNRQQKKLTITIGGGSQINVQEGVAPSQNKDSKLFSLLQGQEKGNNLTSPITKWAAKQLRSNQNQAAAPLKQFATEIFENQKTALVSRMTMYPSGLENMSTQSLRKNSIAHSQSSNNSDQEDSQIEEPFPLNGNTSTIHQNKRQHNLKAPSTNILTNDDLLKRASSSWDHQNVEKFIAIFDTYIDNSDQIGVFSSEIFIKWKNYLQKNDDTRKSELRDCFKQLDLKRKGVLRVNEILSGLNKIDASILDSLNQEKFIQHIQRYYSETKITEEVFVKVMSLNLEIK